MTGVGGYSYLYEPLWWVGMITSQCSSLPFLFFHSNRYFIVLLSVLENSFAVIVGEVANFAAYAFAPAILVTPLGALSIIIRHEFGSWNCILCLTATFVVFSLIWSYVLFFSAVLAHVMLREKLHIFGILGCVLCVVGSTTIVLHAPPEREIESVTEVWDLATEPGIFYYIANIIDCLMLPG